ncbi:MAG: DUF86 domain-containing protein [bacterium]
MKRDYSIYLQDILESISAIEEYVKDFSVARFQDNRQVQDAVIRRLEIIGEAVKNLDDDFRNNYPQIPWKQIAGMRDVLIHEYFGVNSLRVWEAIQKDLPPLKQNILTIINK